ncbi:hypothetical protein [Roseobacter sp. CCS2]|uniref:hypothetical protein n=1 Tax=Roseobacter sp. CCS2 TaxID=391593 RepID=UPI0000F3E52D|nr:hypothetical protein [Roseobacter sp. CCS2]EBA10973.1 hypothetical protein RCCS2_00789 [Roseobacter sp. CCS2]
MESLTRFFKNTASRFLREHRAKPVSSYQLWLEELGNQPRAVIDFLIEDIFFAGDIEKPEDIPELPWIAIELPAGSDTFSLICILANDLEKLGAVVSVREA